MAAPDLGARRAALRERFAVWQPSTLSGFLRSCAGQYGDRPFVITDEEAISYARADAWTTRLADGLTALGIGPGDRVGVLMANYPEFVPVKFAIARPAQSRSRSTTCTGPPSSATCCGSRSATCWSP